MKKKVFYLGVALLLAFSACKKSPESPSNNNSSYPMQMRMTDAAGPYDAVFIDVKQVEVNPGNDDNGWVSLSTRAGIYDLTRLTNGADTFLASGTLGSGTISQIRLILGPNNTVVFKGQTYPLQTPSAQQSGLKLQVHYTMVAGITYVVLLDFDASRSIVSKGNGGFLLKPVIHTSPVATSGAIRGIVSPASVNPAIYAISGSDSTGTFSDVFGHFMFNGMSAGVYNVAFVPAPPLSIKVVNNVSVTNGTVTDLGIITIP